MGSIAAALVPSAPELKRKRLVDDCNEIFRFFSFSFSFCSNAHAQMRRRNAHLLHRCRRQWRAIRIDDATHCVLNWFRSPVESITTPTSTTAMRCPTPSSPRRQHSQHRNNINNYIHNNFHNIHNNNNNHNKNNININIKTSQFLRRPLCLLSSLHLSLSLLCRRHRQWLLMM